MITIETLTMTCHGVAMSLLYAQLIKFIGVTYFIFWITRAESYDLFGGILVSITISFTSIIFHSSTESLKTMRFTRLVTGLILITGSYCIFQEEVLDLYLFGFMFFSAFIYSAVAIYIWWNARLEVVRDISIRSEYALEHSYIIKHRGRLFQLSPFIVIASYAWNPSLTIGVYVLWSLSFLIMTCYDTASRKSNQTSLFWERVRGRPSLTPARHIKKTNAKAASSW